MQRREFTIGDKWKYFLVARGEAGSLVRALDVTQRFLETAEADDHPFGGMLEVDCVVVSIRAVGQAEGWA